METIEKKENMLDYIKYFIEQQQRLIGRSKTYTTVRTYKIRGKILTEFLTEKKLLEVKPKGITIKLIREYDVFLRCKNYCNDYTMKCMQFLGRIMRAALENGDIVNNPMEFYDFHYDRNKNVVYLDLEEIEKIKALNLNRNFAITRDIFLLCCYTGLCYVDIKNFNKKENIIIGPDKKKWIYIKRQKTKNEVYVPLLPEAEAILNFYGGDNLPVKSNTKMNTGLKVIAEKASIKQNLTSHVGRKTFGNVLHNELNVPIETISKIWGYKIFQPLNYQIVKRKLKDDMKML